MTSYLIVPRRFWGRPRFEFKELPPNLIDHIDPIDESDSDDDDELNGAFVPRLLEIMALSKMACIVPVSRDEKVVGIPLDQASESCCEKLLQGPVTTFDISFRAISKRCQRNCSKRQFDDIETWASETVVMCAAAAHKDTDVNYFAWWLKGQHWEGVYGSVIVLYRKAWGKLERQ